MAVRANGKTTQFFRPTYVANADSALSIVSVFDSGVTTARKSQPISEVNVCEIRPREIGNFMFLQVTSGHRTR